MRRVAGRVLIRPGRTPFFVGVAALVLLTSRLTLLPPPAHAVVTFIRLRLGLFAPPVHF